MDLAAEAAGQGQLQMDDQMQADYNRMKTEAGAKTAKMAQDLSSLQVTQKVCTTSPTHSSSMRYLCTCRVRISDGSKGGFIPSVCVQS